MIDSRKQQTVSSQLYWRMENKLRSHSNKLQRHRKKRKRREKTVLLIPHWWQLSWMTYFITPKKEAAVTSRHRTALLTIYWQVVKLDLWPTYIYSVCAYLGIDKAMSLKKIAKWKILFYKLISPLHATYCTSAIKWVHGRGGYSYIPNPNKL